MTLEKKAAIIKLTENVRAQTEVAKECKLSKQMLPIYMRNKVKVLSALEKSHSKDQRNNRKGKQPEESLKL